MCSDEQVFQPWDLPPGHARHAMHAQPRQAARTCSTPSMRNRALARGLPIPSRAVLNPCVPDCRREGCWAWGELGRRRRMLPPSTRHASSWSASALVPRPANMPAAGKRPKRPAPATVRAQLPAAACRARGPHLHHGFPGHEHQAGGVGRGLRLDEQRPLGSCAQGPGGTGGCSSRNQCSRPARNVPQARPRRRCRRHSRMHAGSRCQAPRPGLT